ncbi:nitrilase-related carbon-nitrogen hydrolase [Pseudomonas cavernae]|uniref:nitrilase-related carbon-nitrogen hydrolase n=1 Tax=Pseudomonas cavernae TaxID=2320867 RepID=UPI0013C43F7F|nr:nitrilase-related carbon-nitrogen hydrolase [Pseudomonas cavernae]
MAVIQQPPAFMDCGQTLANVVAAVAEAAAAGEQLIVFPETFVPGYPAWFWRLRRRWSSNARLAAAQRSQPGG